MPKWISVLLLLGYLCAPHVALARSDQGQLQATPAANILGVPVEQVVVIGVGVVAGGLVVHLVVPGELASLAGSVLGGIAANWWYQNGGEASLRPLLKPTHAAAVIHARGEPLLGGAAAER